MEGANHSSRLIELNVSEPVWDRFFWVAPLVLIGTREKDGSYNFAPKHLVTPMGWQNYFGFVCTPRHRTYKNAQRENAFTVSYPHPSQLVLTSLAASPRCSDDSKTILDALPAFPARIVDGRLVEGGQVFLECTLERVVDGFDVNSLVVGKIVAARVDSRAERRPDRDDQQLVHEAPVMAYLHPGRFAEIGHSNSFPFPAGMKK